MPFCAPSRGALLTGRYPFRNGLTGNPAPDGGPQADALALDPGEVTLARALKGAGYATGMVGKWRLGHRQPESLPTRRGFDEYLGIPYSNDMRPVRLLDGETVVEYPVVRATLTRRYTERALRFLERNKDRPFFLYLAHALPHKPLACSEDFYKSGAALYGDALAELDRGVGRVLGRLKALGLDDHTLGSARLYQGGARGRQPRGHRYHTPADSYRLSLGSSSSLWSRPGDPQAFFRGRRRSRVAFCRAARRRDSSSRCCSTCSGWLAAHRSGSIDSRSVSPALSRSSTSRRYAHGSR